MFASNFKNKFSETFLQTSESELEWDDDEDYDHYQYAATDSEK